MTSSELIAELRRKCSDPKTPLTDTEKDLMLALIWVCLDDISKKLSPLMFAYRIGVGIFTLLTSVITAFVIAVATGKATIVFK